MGGAADSATFSSLKMTHRPGNKGVWHWQKKQNVLTFFLDVADVVPTECGCPHVTHKGMEPVLCVCVCVCCE